MQAKLNIVFKLAEELALKVKPTTTLHSLSILDENDRLRLGTTELVEEYEISEDFIDDITSKLNEVKRKSFEIKILEGGKSIESNIELRDLKTRGVEKLIDIPSNIKSQVSAYESSIFEEQEYLAMLKKKSKETIVEDFNLLPNLNYRIGVSFLLTLFSSIFVVLGYIASTDERFYDRDFGYWSMLLGGLALLVTLNLFVIRVIQLFNFRMNKQKKIEELAGKFILNMETKFDTLEKQLREKMFKLEKAVYEGSCKTQLKISMSERRSLISELAEHLVY